MSYAQRYIDTVEWAILEEYLELMSAIGRRDDVGRDSILEAIESRFGRPVPGTEAARVRDGVAIIPVTGPIFRYANLFTAISGGTSFEMLATDFGAVMRDEAVRHVVFDINSPGGEVAGTSEMAQLIRSHRGEKPITAFIGHLGASAALWIASAADRIIAADTSIVGSVGVVATMRNRTSRAGEETLEIVSSQTPDKRANPFSEDADEATKARAMVQQRVDRMAEVFIQAVAENRGMSPEDVISTSGNTFVGQDAVEVGFADEIGTLEGLIRDITTGSRTFPVGTTMATDEGGELHSQEDTMDLDTLKAEHPELVREIAEEAAATAAEQARAEERDRILGINAIPGEGFDDLKVEMMSDPKVTKGDAALRILEARGEKERRQKEVAKSALVEDEELVGDLKGTPATDEPTEEQELVAATQDVLKHAKTWGAIAP